MTGRCNTPAAASPDFEAAPPRRYHGAGNDGRGDDGQAEFSQQLLNHQHRSILPPTSQADLRDNGRSARDRRRGSPSRSALHQPPNMPSRASLSSPANPQPTLQNRPPRIGQPGTARSSAMDIDELANTDEDVEELDVLPLVMSDLDPRYAKEVTTPKNSPPPPSQPSTPPKANGNIQKTPMTVFASLPSLYTPKAGGSVPAPPPPAESATESATVTATKNLSPVVAVGRRSNSMLAVRVKGRPKGWKPGMTYREVALRNAGVDPNDPSVPPEILLPPRPRKTGRPPGRPRLPGGPRPKPSQGAFGFKRVGRPPIQPIEVVQRSIFCNGQACFAPFVCEWTGCRAELHNMATLRKHVTVVHGRPAGAANTCQWRRCADRQTVPARYKDDTDTDADGQTLLEHVEYQHLAPLEWHRGDGFVNNGHIGPPPPPAAAMLLSKARTMDNLQAKTENDDNKPPAAETRLLNKAPEVGLDGVPPDDLPPYLLDDKGKQVTPLLRDGLLEASTFFWTHEQRGRRLKELYRQHQQNMKKRPDRELGRLV
ncbi:hypothetical protein SPBR_03936 [Sporothrix brasiliensis 5110]|uniref:C2H2-type domain-containing protein n=1 Tax=Sporothrix brasiliensis 5110 TaxID=1398154 RepID=A0A0C2FW20_9PEZI|nr:uncharacterized protein SPBR_03936 [Sporothrix brasiliensis 5110]KIH95198.1 hypothetical protein SPBR_03936 [Sporothrix brasiliensis 5110]